MLLNFYVHYSYQIVCQELAYMKSPVHDTITTMLKFTHYSLFPEILN